MPRIGRRMLAGGLVAFWVISLAGCASGHTAGQQLILEPRESATFFYVERQQNDDRDLAANIASNLVKRGYAASSGEAGQAPADVTYLVQYIDHWAWDMRMYLSDLRIEIRDPPTGAILAYGQSVQNSLKAMGWTHDTVVDLALTEIFGQPLAQLE